MMDVIKPSESCILKVWQLDDGIYLKQEDRLLRICPQTESAIRVSYTDQESFSPEQGKEYENSFENVKYLKWKWEDRLHEIIIATQKAFVSVDKATGSVSYFNSHELLWVRNAAKIPKCWKSLKYMKLWKMKSWK